jgi:hypothetical protein
MSLLPPRDEDRRRSPRFSCGGEARIVCLPSDGPFLSGRMRDLSLGGCCVEAASALDCGAQAEIVVRVNSASFRAVSRVKAIRDRAVFGMEFVHLSARGQDMLADAVEGLASLQALMDELRSARRVAEAEMLLRELASERFHAVRLNRLLPVLRAVASPEPPEEPPTSADSESLIVKGKGKIIKVDLFV